MYFSVRFISSLIELGLVVSRQTFDITPVRFTRLDKKLSNHAHLEVNYPYHFISGRETTGNPEPSLTSEPSANSFLLLRYFELDVLDSFGQIFSNSGFPFRWSAYCAISMLRIGRGSLPWQVIRGAALYTFIY
jgi:hypothetical protein